ncbi:MAG TPA: DUF420 domain-containing protein [Thermoanaerobaculia bacterium]|nr:DUF420 domain-containing protein [Thermoanaerobaculia bacterium]
MTPGAGVAGAGLTVLGLTVRDLPALNASLNAIAATLLVVGWLLIRRRRERAHRAVMLAAVVVSALFLTSYLVYHWQVGSVGFQGQGPVRTFYFAVLITHSVLAAAVPVLVVLSLWRAFGRRFRQHRAIARWTLPIWLYVSVTGVIVYWMLYRLEI